MRKTLQPFVSVSQNNMKTFEYQEYFHCYIVYLFVPYALLEGHFYLNVGTQRCGGVFPFLRKKSLEIKSTLKIQLKEVCDVVN